MSEQLIEALSRHLDRFSGAPSVVLASEALRFLLARAPKAVEEMIDYNIATLDPPDPAPMDYIEAILGSTDV